MPDSEYLALKFAIKGNERIRLVLPDVDGYYPIFWFEVKKDGSFYMGPQYDKICQLHSSEAPSHEGGRAIADEALKRGFRISYHGSGHINVGDERLKADSLRKLQTHLLLCEVFFEDPRNRAPIQELRSKSRDKDFPIGLAGIHENRPIRAKVYVTPTRMTQLLDVQDTMILAPVGFNYTGLNDNVPDLTVTLTFHMGPVAPWPPNTMMVVRGEKLPKRE